MLNEETLTVDHIIPSSRGGDNTVENKIASCKRCNCEKGNKNAVEYMRTFSDKKRRKYVNRVTCLLQQGKLDKLKYSLLVADPKSTDSKVWSWRLSHYLFNISFNIVRY